MALRGRDARARGVVAYRRPPYGRPCALTEPAALGRFGSASRDAYYGNFDRCDVVVDRDEGEPVDVEVQFRNSKTRREAPAKTVGTVGVADAPAESDSCGHWLFPAGDADVIVVVLAKQDEHSAPCATSPRPRPAARSTSSTTAGSTGVRPLPRESLGNADACGLLSGSDLEVIPGVDAEDPDIAFGNWECQWGVPPAVCGSTSGSTVAARSGRTTAPHPDRRTPRRRRARRGGRRHLPRQGGPPLLHRR
ncbi:hypothetical protein NKH77_12350 [Streptomyces sp. M19]